MIEQGAAVNLFDGLYHSPLHAAAYYGNLGVAQALLKVKADSIVNQKGGKWGTPLFAACLGNQPAVADIVDLLLAYGADPNVQDCGECDSALQQACDDGNVRVVGLLLEHGADPNIRGGFWGTPLQAACAQGFVELVQMLIDHDADATLKGGLLTSALRAAVNSGNETVVRLMLSSELCVDDMSGDGLNPLMDAVQIPTSDSIIRLLLEHGANPNIKRTGQAIPSNHLRTALQLSNSVSAATLLLNPGAQIDQDIGQYCTALTWACSDESATEGKIQLLADRGADIHRTSWYFGSPLNAACFTGRTDIVNFLVERGASVNEKNLIRHSALQMAVMSPRYQQDIYNTLCAQGADPHQVDRRGCTSLHYAARTGNEIAIESLLHLGAEANSLDSNHWSPLHWATASTRSNVRAIQILLEAGASKNIRDKQGHSALDLTSIFENHDNASTIRGVRNLQRSDEIIPPKFGSSFYCDGCNIV